MRRSYKIFGKAGEWAKHLRKWGKRNSNKMNRQLIRLKLLKS